MFKTANMELRAIVLMIIKIVISIPTVFIVVPHTVLGTALMGGHIDNRASTTLPNLLYLDETDTNETDTSHQNATKGERPIDDAEAIPDPSPLVVPGYNLPDNIFNKGKPFYLEKDPLTGNVDFLSKGSDLNAYDEYDYVDNEDKDTFSKSNIDRKDSNIGSHKPNDMNQLTPTLYEFLNLPVKYNPDKYVYPLISSSYANTKVQGNVDRYYNHKNYPTTTYKPVKTPTYQSTKHSYYKPYKTTPKYEEKYTTTTSTTRKPLTEIYLTSEDNLMNSPINDPSYGEYVVSTSKNKIDSIYLTTRDDTAATTTVPTTTANSETTSDKPMGLFEQFLTMFNDDVDSTTKKATAISTTTTTTTTTTTALPPIEEYDLSEEGEDIDSNEDLYDHNILTGSHMTHNFNEEYDADVTDNIAVENRPHIFTENTTPKEVITTQTSTSTAKTIVVTSKSETNNRNTSSFRPSQMVEMYDDNGEDHYPYHMTYALQNSSQPSLINAIGGIDSSTTEPQINSSYMSPGVVDVVPDRFKENFNHSVILNTPPTVLVPPQVTSMPLGDNHVTHNGNQPIIVATQNLREQLNNEKVPRPFLPPKGNLQPVVSSTNIHIAPHQNTASFVIGNQQNAPSQYPALKESPYDSNPFRPLYGQNLGDEYVSYSIQSNPEVANPPKAFDIKPASINIQPIRNSEASLAIGMPIDLIQGKPGQVVDESLEINKEEIKFPKGTGPKVVFFDEEAELAPFSKHEPKPNYNHLHGNKEILKLSSKPMLHQLPSDLTPPNENFSQPPRPPYDPRPGHFHSGRPEYVRPPRPNEVYKRIDKLPNILPQFRPNMKINHRYDMPNKNFHRQPLLERPSNRPIGFFEKLHPPPPPPKNIQHLRKVPPQMEQELKFRQNVPHLEQDLKFRQNVPQLEQDLKFRQNIPQLEQELKYRQNVPELEQDLKFRPNVAEDRIMNEGFKKTTPEQFLFYPTPPKVILNRRKSDAELDVETLQMIQTKQDKKDKTKVEVSSSFQTGVKAKDADKPLYVVYPVNTTPLKLDAIDTNKKETVVIGTRAELPLPPSKIQESSYDFNDSKSKFDFNFHDRHDMPILKPHPRPNQPIKSDFPYPLERPDPSLLATPEIGNSIETVSKFESNNWNSLVDDPESRIVSTASKINTQDQISVKLKTYTEKPIAVAYTPTEPHHHEKYSLPNYGSSVIPEIRPDHNSEFTVSAVMHTRPKIEQEAQRKQDLVIDKNVDLDMETTHVPQLDFQAPFQPSLNIDSITNGWSAVKEKSKSIDESETTTAAATTTSEFDIENFKPQLIGGFKPIYSFPEDEETKVMEVKEREE